jgi:dTMP kinase
MEVTGMLVVLEGLEGVGKTTLGSMAAERLELPYIKSPPPELNPVRDFIARTPDAEAGFYFYLAGLYAIQSKITAGISQKGAVIVDRYLASTIAYWDAGESFVPPAHDTDRLLVPDLTILITCDEETRLSRVGSRGFHIFERRSVNERAIETFLKTCCNETFVNDGNLDHSVERLCALIRSRLHEHEQAFRQDAGHQPTL